MTETPTPFIENENHTDRATTDPIFLSGTATLKRNRLTVFFRGYLVIPQLIVLSVCSYGYGLAYIFAWIGAMFMGHLPLWAYNFTVWILRFQTYVNAYQMLLTQPWPPFSGNDPYPLTVKISDEPFKQNRLGMFFRGLLIIPAILYMFVLSIPYLIFYIVMWLSGLFLGKVSEKKLTFQLKLHQYMLRSSAYLLLATNVYPKFEDTEVSIVKE